MDDDHKKKQKAGRDALAADKKARHLAAKARAAARREEKEARRKARLVQKIERKKAEREHRRRVACARFLNKLIVAQRFSHVNLVPKSVCRLVFRGHGVLASKDSLAATRRDRAAQEKGVEYCSRLAAPTQELIGQIIDAEITELFATLAATQAVYGRRTVVPNAVLLAGLHAGLSTIEPRGSEVRTRDAVRALGFTKSAKPEPTLSARKEHAVAQKQE
jgi:hypothetical protein